MKNGSHRHGSYGFTLTDSAACLMISKKKTPEMVLCVFTQVWVSVFRCRYTFTSPFTTHRDAHTLAHTIYSLAHTHSDAHFPCCCFKKGEISNGLEQACFLVRVKVWPGLKAAAIRSLLRCLWSGNLLNLHLLGEPHFRYIVRASLHIAGAGHYVKVNTTELWGWPQFLDHIDWRWIAVTHVVKHMDRAKWSTVSLHLLEYIG